MDQVTLQVIIGHNPWLLNEGQWQETVKGHLPDTFILRRLFSPLECIKNKINLVIGPRQSGKSTLIWHYLQSERQPYLLINCEETSCRELCNSPALFLKEVSEIADPIPGLFFEEIQHLDEAGLFLKGLVDLSPGIPIFATGSSSYHLHSKTRESLAGRAIRYYLLPFGMEDLRPRDSSNLIAEEKARKIWNDLLVWGGYPEVVLNRDKQSVLAQLVEAFVLRDASDLYKIKRPDVFRKILSLAAAQIGNLVNFSNWAENTGVSVNTVIEYVSLMAESHLLKLVPPFVGGKRAEITSTPKMFFMDNGLRNLLFGGFNPGTQRADYGALTENLIFTELCKNTNPLLDAIRYWRSTSGAEIDFIVQTGNSLTAIEIKAGDLKRPKVSRALRSFINAYQPDNVFVFNETLKDSVKIEGCYVKFDRLINVSNIVSRLARES